MSKLVVGLLTLGVVLIVGLVFGGYRLYDYVENDAAFCGSCHLMQQAWQTWQAGPHKAVNCHMCHRQDLGDRARIVWHWALREYDSVPPHTRLERRVCEACHLSQDGRWPQVEATAGHNTHVRRVDLECLACHLPSLHAVKPRAEDCQRCHTAARTHSTGMAGLHCTTCHNFLARAEAAPEMLPQRQVCLACHATLQLEGETFPEGAPMAFDCADCHKPHTRPLLQFQDCLGCHASVLEDQQHFAQRALADCVQCHRPHSWRAAGWR